MYCIFSIDFLLQVRSGVNFINMFMSSFYACKSQKLQKTVKSSVIFTVLKSACAKAAGKILLKSTPVTVDIFVSNLHYSTINIQKLTTSQYTTKQLTSLLLIYCTTLHSFAFKFSLNQNSNC